MVEMFQLNNTGTMLKIMHSAVVLQFCAAERISSQAIFYVISVKPRPLLKLCSVIYNYSLAERIH